MPASSSVSQTSVHKLQSEEEMSNTKDNHLISQAQETEYLRFIRFNKNDMGHPADLPVVAEVDRK